MGDIGVAVQGKGDGEGSGKLTRDVLGNSEVAAVGIFVQQLLEELVQSHG